MRIRKERSALMEDRGFTPRGDLENVREETEWYDACCIHHSSRWHPGLLEPPIIFGMPFVFAVGIGDLFNRDFGLVLLRGFPQCGRVSDKVNQILFKLCGLGLNGQWPKDLEHSMHG